MIPICPALRAWLNEHRNGAGDDEPITGNNWLEVSRAVRRLAGWQVEAPILDEQPDATRGPWPINCLRHTSASIQVASGTTLEALVFSFGHAAGHDLLRAHYVGRMPKKEALAILAIGPGSTKVGTTVAA